MHLLRSIQLLKGPSHVELVILVRGCCDFSIVRVVRMFCRNWIPGDNESAGGRITKDTGACGQKRLVNTDPKAQNSSLGRHKWSIQQTVAASDLRSGKAAFGGHVQPAATANSQMIG
jgi:hypothetical protein